MLDPKYVRENIEYIRKVAEDKRSSVDLDKFMNIYDEHKALKFKIDELNAQRNIAAKNKNFELGKQLKDQATELEAKFPELEKEYQEICYKIPNIYSPDTPLGKDDSENIVIRQIGEPKQFAFKAKEHHEIAEKK